MPAAASASSSTRPAGPTKGLPAMSSLSPGCSPTKTTFAVRRPSPNTVCVAFFQRSQAWQCAAASRHAPRLLVSGSSGYWWPGAGAGVIGGSIRAYLVRDYLGGVLGDYRLGGLLIVTLAVFVALSVVVSVAAGASITWLSFRSGLRLLRRRPPN